MLRHQSPVVESQEEAVPPLSQVDAPPRSVSAAKFSEQLAASECSFQMRPMMPDVLRLSDLVIPPSQASSTSIYTGDLNSLRKQAASTTSDLVDLKSRVLALEQPHSADV
eukprot:785566-Amphidinium_carterae.3